jgi:hypothetical protein
MVFLACALAGIIVLILDYQLSGRLRDRRARRVASWSISRCHTTRTPEQEWYARAENAASWGVILTGALALWPLFYPCFAGWLLLRWSRPVPPAVPPRRL